MSSNPQRWQHPGGKLRELGAEALTDAELLSILIAPGIKDKPAEEIAEEILQKVLEIPIPQYNSSNENHKALSQLGEQCAQKVGQLLPQLTKSRSIGHTRRLIRAELKGELEQIDKIVRQILGSSEGSRYATSQGGEV